MNGAAAHFICRGLHSAAILEAHIYTTLLIFLPRNIPMSYLFIKETGAMFIST